MSGLWDKLISSKDRAMFEAEKLRQVTALQGQIRKLQGEIEQSFATLGATTFRLYREGQIQHPELQQACRAIRALQSQIEEHEQEIETLQRQEFQGAAVSGYICPNGHGELPPQNRFCHLCGAEAVRAPAAQQQGDRCGSCGHLIPSGSRFCTECGAPVAADTSAAPGAHKQYRTHSGPSDPAGTRKDVAVEADAEAARTCPNCGSQAAPDTQWCIYCGAALDSSGPGEQVNRGPAPDAGPRLPETEREEGGAGEEGEARGEEDDRYATVRLPETDERQATSGNETMLLPETEGEQQSQDAASDDATILASEAEGEEEPQDGSGTTLLPETEAERLSENDMDSDATVLLPETKLDSEISRCRACGSELIEGTAFCTNCGEAIAS